MNYACETDVLVQNENALRFSIISRPAPLLEYTETVSSLIGTSHILAVFEETDAIKIYFDDKRYVDTIIRSSIHVQGRHVKVDYVVPPGIKVYLSKVDPVITNFDLMRLLSMYGKIVSPIISPPLSDDAKLCHISYGERYVYMIIEKPIPERVDFKYGSQLCSVDIKIESSQFELPFIKTEYNSDVDYLDDVVDSVQDPVLVSVESASEDNATALTGTNEGEGAEENAVNCNDESSSTVDLNTSATSLETRCNYKIRKLTTVNKIKRRKCFVPKRVNHFAKRRKWPKRRMPHQSSTLPHILHSSPSDENPLTLSALKENTSPMSLEKNHTLKENISPVFNYAKEKTSPPCLENHTSSKDNQSSSSVQEVKSSPVLEEEISLTHCNSLTDEEILDFLNRMKYQRAPLDFIKKYFGKSYNSETLKSLVMQLRDYRHRQNCLTFRIRLDRLIKLFSNAI